MSIGNTSSTYAQLDFMDLSEVAIKAEIVKEIAWHIRSGGIVLQDAADILGVPPYDIELALCGKLLDFRPARLRRWLDRLSSSPM